MSILRRLRPLSSLLALLAVFAGQATVVHAGTLGGIAGTVTDAKTGAPIAGARVQISSPSEAITATTDAKGHYTALSLQPDNYTLTAVKDGYTAESLTGESVFADQTQQYDLQLTPSDTTNQ
jgi:hypothetical protein